MSKKGLVLIVLMMAIALLGLIGMQAYYISESYKLNAQLFDQGVMTALNNASRKIEKVDAARFMQDKIAPLDLPEVPSFDMDFFLTGPTEDNTGTAIPRIVTVQPYKGVNIISHRDAQGDFRTDILFSLYDGIVRRLALPDFEEFLKNSVNRQIEVRNGQVYYNESPPFGITPKDLREKVQEHQKIVEKQLTSSSGTLDKANDIRFMQITAENNVQPISPDELVQIQKKMATASRKQQAFDPAGLRRQQLKQFIDSLKNFEERMKVFEELAAELQTMHLPLKERVSLSEVDSVLGHELKQQGIDLPYDVEIRGENDQKVLFATHKTGYEEQPDIYRTSLFPQDFVKGNSGELLLKIPNKDRYLSGQMTLLTASSGALILVIIICFALTIYSMLRQKKLSQMKSDFINNMTHEFKTPVSTIMLASEALKDEDMSANQNQVQRYAGIIYDENLRLGSYVERVLNMARLEKSDFRLERNILSVNELISAVIDSMDLQLKKKKAHTQLELDAGNDRISGDELHLSNVIYNLVDNAVKYSPGEARIHIRTESEGGRLRITVADAGIGMSREQRKKIFEKFYRVQSGNLHDVKGFGLGLSYVNSIVKLLDGDINVQSEPEQGSEFEITFPLARS